jgi:hypothetical protein
VPIRRRGTAAGVEPFDAFERAIGLKLYNFHSNITSALRAGTATSTRGSGYRRPAMRRRTWAGTLAAVVAGWTLGGAPAALGGGTNDYAAIRADWAPDHVITACRFTVEQLENARSMLTGEDNYTDFPSAIDGEISRQRTGGCPGGGGLQGAPVVSRARFTPAAFRAGRGGTLRFGLSRAATVRVAIERRQGARWAAMSTLVRPVRRAGNAALPYRPRGLAAGSYRATVVATAGGRRSRPARAAFRVLG